MQSTSIVWSPKGIKTIKMSRSCELKFLSKDDKDYIDHMIIFCPTPCHTLHKERDSSFLRLCRK